MQIRIYILYILLFPNGLHSNSILTCNMPSSILYDHNICAKFERFLSVICRDISHFVEFYFSLYM